MSSATIDSQQVQGAAERRVPEPLATLEQAVALEAYRGLSAEPRSLTAWLFYDERGSQLFEQITTLPEYYLTRTERAIFEQHAAEIVEAAGQGARLTVIELGAGTASKSGVLLRAASAVQGEVLYQPIDVSESALDEAGATLEAELPGVRVVSQVADYTAGPLSVTRPEGCRVLSLYIGSSIGNFFPEDALEVLTNLRSALEPGDSLLLGADLAPGPNKSLRDLLQAYDDATGVTAAFNRNVLVRLNRELGANFDTEAFAHEARWNEGKSRIEMHLRATSAQRVVLPAGAGGAGLTVEFREGETIHTENSYKFTKSSLAEMLERAGFRQARVWHDEQERFAVTLAFAV